MANRDCHGEQDQIIPMYLLYLYCYKWQINFKLVDLFQTVLWIFKWTGPPIPVPHFVLNLLYAYQLLGGLLGDESLTPGRAGDVFVNQESGQWVDHCDWLRRQPLKIRTGSLFLEAPNRKPFHKVPSMVDKPPFFCASWAHRDWTVQH